MSDFKKRLSDVRVNPGLMQNVILDELERQVRGQGEYDVPDASNPFVFLMEAGVLNTSMAITEGEALLRRLYPRMAITQEELYLHMSDIDLIGRFSSPAWSQFEIYLSKDEVMAKAVSVGNGVRKLTIPRATHITVAETVFTLQYPIELRVLSHGGIQIVYNTDDVSPIQTLESNLVEWDLVNINREELLVLRVPVGQFKTRTHHETINMASGFNVNYTFTDRFYYARVYVSGENNEWDEVRTTHTDQVYDPAVITAALQVNDDQLNVKFPPVYFTTGRLNGEVRIDIYTTKGELEMDLGGYQADQFTMVMNDIDDDSRFVAPLRTFNRLKAVSPARLMGGSNGLSFTELRNQVLTNSLGISQLPITHAQLETELSSRGFSVVTNVDNITNRQFLVSRKLPNSDTSDTVGAMGCTMGLLQNTVDSLSQYPSVHLNGDRLTLTPDLLYEYVDGTVTVVPGSEIEAMDAMRGDALSRVVNTRRFLYTPFHYVLETTEERFNVRPYYLDNPTVVRKTFVGENDTSAVQMSAETYTVTRIDEGYRLTVKLKTSDQVKEFPEDQIIVQLGYMPPGEVSYASMNGVRVDTVDGEGVYQFDLHTDYDITADGQLRTLNFTMFSDTQNGFYVPLLADFDLSYVVGDSVTVGYQEENLDGLVQRHLLPDDHMVVSRERLSLRLGYDLSGLWRRNRTLISSSSYRRYTHDIPYVYTNTTFKRDANGQLILGQDTDGNLTYVVEHEKGSPKLDEDGTPKLRFIKGDPVLKENGEPELIAPRALLREFTMLFFDGRYRFADEARTVAYRDEIPMQIVGWMDNDLSDVQAQLLEQSELHLYPTETIGDTRCLVNEGYVTTIPLEQHMEVNYYLKPSAFNNGSLRDALVRSTRESVNRMLGRRTVAVSDMIAQLKTLGGDDVISVNVTGLGGPANYSVVTIQDDAVRLSLGKRLLVRTNQLLAIQDSIDINFLRHQSA